MCRPTSGRRNEESSDWNRGVDILSHSQATGCGEVGHRRRLQGSRQQQDVFRRPTTTKTPTSSLFWSTTDHHSVVVICEIHLIIIIIIIIIKTMFMVLSSWQSHCESSPGLFDEYRTAPSGRRPKTKPDDLGCESACTGCQSLHPPSPFIIITQPKTWYSFYRSTEGRKLSRLLCIKRSSAVAERPRVLRVIEYFAK